MRGGLTRRGLLIGAATSPLLAARAFALEPGEAPPIVFAHGNGDHAGLWMTQLWRFESNGWPRERLHAFNFLDPLARLDIPNLARETGDALELAEADGAVLVFVLRRRSA